MADNLILPLNSITASSPLDQHAGDCEMQTRPISFNDLHAQRSREVFVAGRSSGTRRRLSRYVPSASLPNTESSAAKAVSEITPDAHQARLCSPSARLHAEQQKRQPDLSVSAADISEGSSGEELQMDSDSTRLQPGRT